MKLVKYLPDNNVASENINEKKAYKLASTLELKENKSIYEFARGYDEYGILNVIYKENRIVRTRNTWYERRAITTLSREINLEFLHSYKLMWKGFETEIDAVSLDKKIAVEIKRQTINGKIVNFLEDKVYSLGFEELIIIAPKFKISEYSSNTKLYQFRPSYIPILKYYNKEYTDWKAFWQLSAQRHFRFMMANGRWKPQRRRYTTTARWKASQRMITEINYYHKHYVNPIKIYYSLSRHIGPLHEFEGKGYPISRFLAAFDVDGEHEGNHIIGKLGYCEMCRADAFVKKNIFIKYLCENNHEVEVLNSGAKGYHVYLMKNNAILELSQNEMENIVKENINIVDSFLSKNTKEFDQHRIFKVPYTIDGSTGYVVSNQDIRILFNDKIIKY